MVQREENNQSICIAEYVSAWLLRMETACKPSTYSKYRGIFERYLLPVAGSSRPQELSTVQLEEIFTRIRQLSPKTQNDILCLFRKFFSWLEAEGCTVPVSLKGIRIRQKARRTRVFSIEEQRLLCQYLLQGAGLCRMGVYLSLYTGIRIGELCALKRKNLSFGRRSLTVEKTMQRIQTGNGRGRTEVVITEAKSRCSVREIPLPDFLMSLCMQSYGGLEPEAFLLSGRTDKYVEPRTLQNRFRQYLLESGVAKAGFHTLRHTFATRCVEQGVDTRSLSELLGHVSVNITMDRYVHPSMELKRRNMEKLGGLLSRRTPEE